MLQDRMGRARAAEEPPTPTHSFRARLCAIGIRVGPIEASRAVHIATLVDLCDTMCEDAHMATNLLIDPDLIEQVFQVSGERTKKAAVTKALQEFIVRRRQQGLLDLMGKLEWDAAYDHKAGRTRD
jgi:Arc/MetJ family transcription regulator